MEIILQLPLCLYKLKRLVICVDDYLLQNGMFPLPEILKNRIHLLIVGGVFQDCIGKFHTVIGH